MGSTHLELIPFLLDLNMKIIVITGWGLGTALLEPFVQLFKAQGHQVKLWDIFDPFDSEILLEKLDQAAQSELLLGWSLGGQIALYLADCLQKQRKITLPVICCMSNPCFVAQQNWLEAMPKEKYQQFASIINMNPYKGIQRFSHLVSMGSVNASEHAKILQKHFINIDLNYQKKHLYLLDQLDLREKLQTSLNKMLFIFSEYDQLVPCKVSNNIQNIAEDRIKIKILKGAHDLILFEPKLIIATILDFIDKEVGGSL